MHRIVTTCTRDCPCACGLIAESDGTRVVNLRGNPDHPLTRGGHCAKLGRFLERSLHPERQLFPLRRNGSGFTRVTWDTALNELAERLGEAISRHGPASVLHYQGFGERTALKLLNMRFFSLLGGVTALSGTLCGGTGQAAMELSVGKRVSHDPEDHANAKTLVIWGRNPAVTGVALLPVMKKVRQAGGRIIVIDPLPTATAKTADLHIRPRPGGDAWLALAACKHVLDAKRDDMDFGRDHAEGYETFCAMLNGLSSMELTVRADVPKGQVRALAEAMAENTPAAVVLGWGLHRHEHAHQAIQAIHALSAMTGNMGVPGGGVSQGFEEYGPFDWAVTGEDETPPRRRLRMPRIGRDLLDANDPPVTTAVVSAGNPLCMAPNSGLVAQAFGKLDFLCVMGHFLDDTAQAADLFLPATTFLEINDVVASYGHNWLGPVNRAMPPRGEARPNHEVYFDLADRLGLDAGFRNSDEEWLSIILKPTLDGLGLSLADAMCGPVRLNAPTVPYADKVFPTPSGRFRFMTAISDPEPACDPREYPLSLLTTSPAAWLCSELPPPDLDGLPRLALHPDEAARLGLSDGQTAMAESPVGKLRVAVATDAGLRPDTALLARGGWNCLGHGVNVLTLDLVSAVGGGTPYYSTRIRLKPATAEG